jgi:hypothetical protein
VQGKDSPSSLWKHSRRPPFDANGETTWENSLGEATIVCKLMSQDQPKKKKKKTIASRMLQSSTFVIKDI